MLKKLVYDVLSAKAAADNVLPVGIVGVGQHVDAVALLTQLLHFLETVLGDADATGVPRVNDLLSCGAWMA